MKSSLKYNERHIIIGIFSLAIFLRLVYLLQIKTNPQFDFPLGDSITYLDLAERTIREGFFYKDIYFTSGIIYIYFLALILYIFGRNYLLITTIQIILGAFNCVLVYLIGKSVFNNKIGIIAALIASFYGVLIFFNGELLAATLGFFLFNISILLFLKFQNNENKRNIFFGGMFLGLAALGSPNISLLLAGVLIWIFTLDIKTKKRLIYGTFCLLGFLITISPATIKNFVSGNDFILISGNGGINFYIGNNPSASGAYTLPEGMGLENTENFHKSTFLYPEKVLDKKLKASEVSRFWFNESINFIRENPYKEIGLLWKKFLLFLNSYEIANHNNYYFFKRFSTLLSMPLISFGVIAPLGLLGILLSLKHWRRYLLLYIFLVLYSASIILFFVTARYRLPSLSIIILFGAYALWWYFEKIKEKGYKQVFLSLLPLSLFIVLVNHGIEGFYSTVNFDQEYNKLGYVYYQKGMYDNSISAYNQSLLISPNDASTHYLLGTTYVKMGNHDKAEKEFKDSLVLKSDRPYAHYKLGMIFYLKGKLSDAMKHLQEEIEIQPDFTQAHYNLAVIYDEMGLLDEAIKSYAKTIELDSGHFMAYNNLGIIYGRKNQYDKAVVQFQKALEIKPGDEEAMYNLETARKKIQGR
jgi:tetratricopeptide (TPR) repeat protein